MGENSEQSKISRTDDIWGRTNVPKLDARSRRRKKHGIKLSCLLNSFSAENQRYSVIIVSIIAGLSPNANSCVKKGSAPNRFILIWRKSGHKMSVNAVCVGDLRKRQKECLEVRCAPPSVLSPINFPLGFLRHHSTPLNAVLVNLATCCLRILPTTGHHWRKMCDCALYCLRGAMVWTKKIYISS